MAKSLDVCANAHVAKHHTKTSVQRAVSSAHRFASCSDFKFPPHPILVSKKPLRWRIMGQPCWGGNTRL